MAYSITRGNCFELLQNIPARSIDLIVTDPPYIIENQGGGIYQQENKTYVKEIEDLKNGFDFAVLDEFCRVLKKINIYIWCSQKQIIPLLDYFVKVKKCNYNLITWHKTNPIPACGNKYLTDTEFCLFFREKGVKVYGEYKSKLTYYVTPLNVEDKKKYGHPTIKPLNIIQNFILNSTEPGGVVLDPFMGSGTTGEASINMGRDFIGFEINETHFITAKNRIKDASSNVQRLNKNEKN